jgi:predicted membrane-bound spermidine synthase
VLFEWLFFASGFAALLYQVMWQRTLFTLWGINAESVTVIVTAFMVGLGVGSLAGGIVSRDPTRRTALWFAGCELAIGVYGIVSLPIFHFVGALMLPSSAGLVALATFFLVLIPTTLMGATLPLLVSHFTRINKHVGDSVGSLYHTNTLGAAAGAFAAGIFLPGLLGQAGTLRVAVALNLAAAAIAFVKLRNPVVPAAAEESA